MATSRRSSLAKMRLCIFASIFELLPLVQSSERALLLKVRITAQCKQLAYVGQDSRVPRRNWRRVSRAQHGLVIRPVARFCQPRNPGRRIPDALATGSDEGTTVTRGLPCRGLFSTVHGV